MNFNFLILVIGAIILNTACEEDSNTVFPEPGQTIPNVLSDGQLFDDLISDRSDASSDPFTILGIERSDNLLLVEVQYSGGCEEHQFNLVWDPEIRLIAENEIGPNQAQLIIIHDGNGDLCEAALRETLTIDLSEISATININQLNIRVLNASNDQTFSAFQGFMGISESQSCDYEVVLTQVVCGDGLFENKWFRFPGKEEPAFLQPASIAFLAQLDPDPPIGRYRVGVRVSTWSPDPNIAICLAYPGPSVPVEIWCMELIEEGDF